jgi:beta-aspartyl-peptidase (threonine type)
MKKSAIIVHGGAGAWQIGTEYLQNGIEACIAAAKAGQAILLEGGSALDAVETAVRILEDSPELDAGRGSYPNTKGEIEMDALIMDGASLNLGAIAAVQRIRYPISLARRVLEHGDHNFLVGSGAESFADSIGFPRCELADLLVREAQTENQQASSEGDTVGAVALDSHGNLATATSTGGTRNQIPGRVGDSPLVGSGGFADNNTAATSATGRGEDLMKVVISKQVCDFVAVGLSAQGACDAAINLLTERVNGRGGLITIDFKGQVGMAFNTSAMPHAYAIGNGAVISGR